jgi:gas vesicle protein
MDLTYEDTMDDIIGTWIGAVVGALFVLTRTPRAKANRGARGWRAMLGA